MNISPVQLGQEGLVSCVADVLRESGLDPRWLELEITESGIMVNERDAIVKLSELHSLGITISIDDFGTGYSSFSKLKDFPVDTLKIDKSFIDPLPSDDRAKTITVAIIELAHNLGFQVVAEGIEKTEQLEFLDRHSCDQYQGYLFSKPLSSGDFEKLFKAGKLMIGGKS